MEHVVPTRWFEVATESMPGTGSASVLPSVGAGGSDPSGLPEAQPFGTDAPGRASLPIFSKLIHYRKLSH